MFVKPNNELEKQIKYITSDALILRTGDDTQEFIKILYESMFKNFEKESNSLRGSNFVFDGIDLTYVQFIRLKLKRGGSYIPTTPWIHDKKAVINPQNTKNDCCLAHSIIISIHSDEIGKNAYRISKLKPFIDRYDWSDANFPSEKKDWDRIERQNKVIALNILSAHPTKKKLDIIRTSKHNNDRKHKVTLLMITEDGKNWHYVSVKNVKGLYRGVFSNNHGDFYCMNCVHTYRTRGALKKHERLCLNHKHCHIKLPDKDNNILSYTGDDKSIRSPHITYADLE